MGASGKAIDQPRPLSTVYPPYEEDWDRPFERRRVYPIPPNHEDELEDIVDYVDGGFHPVHLMDVLNGRFEVFYKLGFGENATSWLCYDLELMKWRTLKILTARDSKLDCPEMNLVERLRSGDVTTKELDDNHIVYPYEYFALDGPNGRHLCFVLPVLGPTIETKINESDSHKEILFQIAEGLHFFNRKGIRHGQLRPQNILLRLRHMDHISREQMTDRFGDPDTEQVQTLNGTRQETCPTYLVMSTDLSSLGVTNEVAIVETGEHFHITDIPRQPELAMSYAAPEDFLNFNPGLPSDIWSFGCTMAEIRAGRNLFGVGLFGGGEESQIRDLEYFFGPLPEPYRGAWEVNQEGASDYHSIDGDETSLDGDEKPLEPVSMSLAELLEERRAEADETGFSDTVEAAISTKRSWFNFPLDEQGNPVLDAEPIQASHQIPKGEVPILGDLLRRIFKYNPNERISTLDILNHEWFKDFKMIKVEEDQDAQILPGTSSDEVVDDNSSDIESSIESDRGSIDSTPSVVPQDELTYDDSAAIKTPVHRGEETVALPPTSQPESQDDRLPAEESLVEMEEISSTLATSPTTPRDDLTDDDLPSGKSLVEIDKGSTSATSQDGIPLPHDIIPAEETSTGKEEESYETSSSARSATRDAIFPVQESCIEKRGPHVSPESKIWNAKHPDKEILADKDKIDTVVPVIPQNQELEHQLPAPKAREQGLDSAPQPVNLLLVVSAVLGAALASAFWTSLLACLLLFHPGLYRDSNANSLFMFPHTLRSESLPPIDGFIAVSVLKSFGEGCNCPAV